MNLNKKLDTNYITNFLSEIDSLHQGKFVCMFRGLRLGKRSKPESL